MSVYEKKQCPIRLYPSHFKRVQEKAINDGLTFQKVAEVLFHLYDSGNKEVTKHVKEYAESQKKRSKRATLDLMESKELLAKVESMSPFQDESDFGLEDDE